MKAKRKPKAKKVNKKLTKKAAARKKVNSRKAAPAKAPTKRPKKPAPTQRKPSERGGPAPTKVPTKVRVSEFGAPVKRRAPQVHAPETTKRKRKRALSRNPDAVRARKYRRERRAIADALEAEREEKLEARRIRDRERRRQKREPKGPASREVAELWLRAIRDDFAHGTETTLEIVPDPGGGGPWLISGLFSFLEPLSYAELGEALQYLQDDLILTARINPSRLTRLHILFVDPHDTRGRAGNIVSKISGYEYAIGDAITEILGGRPDDENALAVRYEDTRVGEMYVSFAATVVQYRTAFPTGPQPQTQTIHLRGK